MKENEKIIKDILEKTESQINQKKEEEVREQIPEKLRSLEKESSVITELIERVKFIYQMIFDPNFSISKEHKYMFLAALLYFLIPTDLIMDFVPAIGLLDDAMVLKLVWKSLQDEIERYRLYLESRQE
jgi:uncharacterized membrane protein YkvA (DUF1232 family)